MFDWRWRRLFGFAWKGTRDKKSHLDPVRVLLITEDYDLGVSVEEIAKGGNWSLTVTASLEDALTRLESGAIRIVILDRDLTRVDWRLALQRLHALTNPACVFVASRAADRYMWDEVVRNHGYDVLPKPFRPDEVMRTVDLAWYWGAWKQQH